jgi:hypothetical protein
VFQAVLIGSWSSSNDIRFRIHGTRLQINLIALYKENAKDNITMETIFIHQISTRLL